MQCLTKQTSKVKRLDPAPWLQNVCFTEGLQFRFHMYRAQNKCQLEKDLEFLEKIQQPDLLMKQFEMNQDEKNDFLDCNDEFLEDTMCSCATETCCINFAEDHGITDALKSFRMHGTKGKRTRKRTRECLLQNAHAPTKIAMEVDSEPVPSERPQPSASEPKRYYDRTNFAKACIQCGSSSGPNYFPVSIDVAPMEQRSCNKNGKSMQDGNRDAMSTKSDSRLNNERTLSSALKSESRNKTKNDILNRLSGPPDICFCTKR